MAQALETPPADRMRISEIYRTIQGESSLVGYPSVFVRVYTCNLRCAWCDSMHAVEGGDFTELAVAEVVKRARDLAGKGIWHVCWTGGEPLLQWRAIADAIQQLPGEWVHSVETDGEVPIAPMNKALPMRREVGLVRYVMDVKCPGSGMTAKLAFENLAHLRKEDEVKFVVLDRADYEFARGVVRRQKMPAGTVLFSPVSAARGVPEGLDPAKLAAWILEDGLDVRLQVQMHKVVWPGKERGV